jgi:hypothetical protein
MMKRQSTKLMVAVIGAIVLTTVVMAFVTPALAVPRHPFRPDLVRLHVNADGEFVLIDLMDGTASKVTYANSKATVTAR